MIGKRQQTAASGGCAVATRAAVVNETKVLAAVALCDELRRLSPDEPAYTNVARRIDQHWRNLSRAEQDEVDRIFGQRGRVRWK